MSYISYAQLVVEETEIAIQNQADDLIETIVAGKAVYPVDLEEIFAYIRQQVEKKMNNE